MWKRAPPGGAWCSCNCFAASSRQQAREQSGQHALVVRPAKPSRALPTLWRAGPSRLVVAQRHLTSRRQGGGPAPAWPCVHQLRRRKPAPARPGQLPSNPGQTRHASTAATNRAAPALPPPPTQQPQPQQTTAGRWAARLTAAPMALSQGWISHLASPGRQASASALNKQAPAAVSGG